jgi:hypothetical protein
MPTASGTSNHRRSRSLCNLAVRLTLRIVHDDAQSRKDSPVPEKRILGNWESESHLSIWHPVVPSPGFVVYNPTIMSNLGVLKRVGFRRAAKPATHE